VAKFDPGVHAAVRLEVHGVAVHFRTTEHPNAPGIVHAMEGAKGRVYSLQAADGARYALKVMKPRHKLPDLASGCQAIERFKTLSGMTVCNRYCLTTSSAPLTVRELPQLEFAILMPWIEGRSWFDVVAAKTRQPMSARQARDIAAAFAVVCAGLEDAGVAHCDLSAGNIIVVGGAPPRIELIDVEDIFAPGLQPPKFKSAGTPGYQHAMSATGQWGPDVDRFAAAVLVAEMLAWCDPKIVRDAYGESIFDPVELQSRQSSRFKSVLAVIDRTVPGSGVLFERAWKSNSFAECPKLSEWRALLVGPPVAAVGTLTPTGQPLPRPEPTPAARPTVIGWDGIVPSPTSRHGGNAAVQWGPPIGGAPHPSTAGFGVSWEALNPGVTPAVPVAEWTGELPTGSGPPQPTKVAWQGGTDQFKAPPAQRPTFVWEQVPTPTTRGS
jgi:hypothetical protein